MKKVSFIHCSDLHLGCNQFNDAQRFNDFGDAFSNIVDYAIDKKVQYLFIGGDLFHHRSVNAQTLIMAIELLGRLRNNGIEVVAIEGNHDKAFYVDEESWMRFLNTQGFLKLLKPLFFEGKLQLESYNGKNGCVIDDDDLRIIGLGYLGATTKQRLEEAAELIELSDKFTVALLHVAVDKLLGQDLAGVGKNCFLPFSDKIDYFALGHIHSRSEHLDFIFNPGAPESVHIDEVRKNQDKGFYHVIIEGKAKSVEFITSHRRAIRYFDIDISGISVPSDVIDVVIQKMDASDIHAIDKPLVQVNLFGTVDFNSFAINTGKITDTLKSKYDCLVVEVINNANLLQLADNTDGNSFDRSSIEKLVISKMVVEEKPEFKSFIDDIADLILTTKNYSLTGISEDEIINNIGRALEQMPLTEATMTEEVESSNEN